jgi:hypothetical protein
MIKQKNKKGVSDVITTVLIILLVLAAVAIIGGILLRNIGEAGSKIGTQQACIDLDVKPTQCIALVGTDDGKAKVSVARGGRGSDAKITEVRLLIDNSGVVTPYVTSSNDDIPNPLQTTSITTDDKDVVAGTTKVRVAVQVTGTDGKSSLCEPSLEVVTCT